MNPSKNKLLDYFKNKERVLVAVLVAVAVALAGVVAYVNPQIFRAFMGDFGGMPNPEGDFGGVPGFPGGVPLDPRELRNAMNEIRGTQLELGDLEFHPVGTGTTTTTSTQGLDMTTISGSSNVYGPISRTVNDYARFDMTNNDQYKTMLLDTACRDSLTIYDNGVLLPDEPYSILYDISFSVQVKTVGQHKFQSKCHASTGNWHSNEVIVNATPRCGDGKKEGAEVCDDGNTVTETSCAYGTSSCTGCNATCTQSLSLTGGTCGNGTVESGEVCDSGAANSGDWSFNRHCGANCQWGPYCGDGQIGGMEYCDGTNLNGKTCANFMPGINLEGDLLCAENCTLNWDECTVPAECGNGVKESGETCDDGLQNGQYGKCNQECSSVLRCGDGVVNGSEVCDGSVPSAKSTCALAVGEGSTGTPACTSSCIITGCSAVPRCGDGSVNKTGEQCDPPSSSQNCAYNQTSCTVCNSSCQSVDGTLVGHCGDGQVQTAFAEVCDGTNLNSQTCGTRVAGTSGPLACASDCKTFNTSGCSAYTILNCPSAILPASHANAHPKVLIKGAGSQPFVWKVDGAIVSGTTGDSAKLTLSAGNVGSAVSHTVTLNDSATCTFSVEKYTKTAGHNDVDAITAILGDPNHAANPAQWELMLYDYSMNGTLNYSDKTSINTNSY